MSVQGGKLLAEFVLAMQQGLGLNKIPGTVRKCLTVAEVSTHAAAEWNKAHATERLPCSIERHHRWRRGLAS